MAINENLIPIPGRLHSVATEGHVAGANEIYDDVQSKSQETINRELISAVGTGGSVDTRIENAIKALDATVSQTAGADGLALSITEVDGKITAISGSIAANTYDASGAAATAKSDLLGDATTDYNTLGKLEDKIQENTGDIDDLEELVPSQASSSNQLADKAFVNSSISTATATFRGTSAADLTEQEFLAWANALTKDANDYVFWNTEDSDGNTIYKRYKYDGTQWAFEYELNNSSFTAAQWATIESGMTDALTAKLSALPTNAQLTESLNSEATTRANADTAINNAIGTDSTTGSIKGRITDLETAVGTGGSVDSRIAAAKSELKGNATSACDTLGEAEALIDAEETRAMAAESNLQQLYQALTQSDIVVVNSVPASGVANTIYRVIGANSYADYMFNSSDLNTAIKMAEYDNAIDNTPTANSDNLVKSGGVAAQISQLGQKVLFDGGYKSTLLLQNGVTRIVDLSPIAGKHAIARVSAQDGLQFGYYYGGGYRQIGFELNVWVEFDVPDDVSDFFIYSSQQEATVEIVADLTGKNVLDIEGLQQNVGVINKTSTIPSGSAYRIVSLTPFRGKEIAVRVLGTYTQFGYYDSSQQGYTVISGMTDNYISILIPDDADDFFVFNGTGETQSVETTLLSSMSLSIFKNREDIDFLNNAKGCVLMSLGDSITTEGYYINKLRNILQPSRYYNLAVASATWADRADTNSYDGNPSFSGDQSQNVLGNQVQKILNNPSVYDIAPDIIIISAGTNDGINVQDIDDDVIETYFTRNNGTEAVNCTTPTFLPTDTYSPQRKNIIGAMRYVCSTLQNLYPNAKIFILTPIQGSVDSRVFSDIREKQVLISKVARRLALPVIHVGEYCGIYQDFEYLGSYWNSSLATVDHPKNGRDLIDGLHPNNSGSQKMANYIAKFIANSFLGY